jgi:hypothetical protein
VAIKLVSVNETFISHIAFIASSDCIIKNDNIDKNMKESSPGIFKLLFKRFPEEIRRTMEL